MAWKREQIAWMKGTKCRCGKTCKDLVDGSGSKYDVSICILYLVDIEELFRII